MWFCHTDAKARNYVFYLFYLNRHVQLAILQPNMIFHDLYDLLSLIF